MPIVAVLFLSPLSSAIFGSLSLFILPIGSIIIIGIYRSYLKKMSGETNRNKGIVGIVNGIIILSIGLSWIYFFLMIMIDTSWRGTAWGVEYGILILGIIFILIGLVITPYGIIGIYKSIHERRT
ncbi:MAG: hypothetical protein ACFFAQ_03305 [Promethearchaeota archaeon]